MPPPPPRSSPNILITGTPGVGKSSLAAALASATGLKHIQINDIVREKPECRESWDAKRECWVLDEDKLLDELEPMVEKGGTILDYHACDFFPESWIDLVVVLGCETEVLYDRLRERGYKEDKVQENLDAEIMMVVAEEAREGFEEGVVVVLKSNSVEDIEGNVERVEGWLERWRVERGGK
jgi:adenylate kinase